MFEGALLLTSFTLTVHFMRINVGIFLAPQFEGM